ncbi:hypothetical protein JB92DRAFT_1115704 [Gautieria morchelliformis]|nr:hypothetical protein JB92DRAFT_1115704 [Gautieria morchelliformis]
MDKFINLAQQGLKAYEGSQSHNQSGDGGNVQDRRHHDPQEAPQFDHNEVINQANQHAGDSGNHSFFASAMSHLSGHGASEHHQPIDEEHVTNSHKQAYEQGNARSLDANGMGAAAAMQAMKMFTSGSGGGGGGSSQLVSLAMGEASKLFDASGGSSSGGKQDVINGAAMTMMKLVVQSKFSSGGGGGLGGIMSMANKLM